MRKSYPAVPLGTAVEALQQIRQTGIGPFNRQELMKMLGYSDKSGRGNNVISALVHYGLIYKRDYYYYVSSLGIDTLGQDTENKYKSMFKAFLKPGLFNEVFERFGSKLSENIKEEISKNYKLSDSSTDLFVKNYNNSIIFIEFKSHDKGVSEKETMKQIGSYASEAPIYPKSNFRPDIAINASALEDSISVDFGDGFVAEVPKKVILRAYLEELQKKLAADMATGIATGDFSKLNIANVKAIDCQVGNHNLWHVDKADTSHNFYSHIKYDPKQKPTK
jgi:hypothetical protein